MFYLKGNEEDILKLVKTFEENPPKDFQKYDSEVFFKKEDYLFLKYIGKKYPQFLLSLFGVFFLKEPFGLAKIFGFILLTISLFAINYVKSGDSNIKLPLKWIVSITTSFVGNGMCSTVQKLQQINSNGKYKSEFMIFALIIVFVILLPTSLWFEKGKIRTSIKSGGLLAIAYGLANGLVNWLVMFLGNRIPVSILFPVVSAGGIIVSTIISVVLYKEKLSKIQTIGVLAGITSIVFINF